MFMLCFDLMEQIGKEVVEVRETRKRDMCRERPTCHMDREFKAIVNVLAKRNKPLTLRNMKYKYVQKDSKVKWHRGTSLYQWKFRVYQSTGKYPDTTCIGYRFSLGSDGKQLW